MKNCYRFKTLISNYLDKEITFNDRKFFNEHLKDCKSCKFMFNSITDNQKSLKNLPKITVSENFMPDLRNKILADRNAKILASQNLGFSFRRIPSYTYAFSSILAIVVIGFIMMKIPHQQNPAGVALPPMAMQKSSIIQPRVTDDKLNPNIMKQGQNLITEKSETEKRDSTEKGSNINFEDKIQTVKYKR